MWVARKVRPLTRLKRNANVPKTSHSKQILSAFLAFCLNILIIQRKNAHLVPKMRFIYHLNIDARNVHQISQYSTELFALLVLKESISINLLKGVRIAQVVESTMTARRNVFVLRTHLSLLDKNVLNAFCLNISI